MMPREERGLGKKGKERKGEDGREQVRNRWERERRGCTRTLEQRCWVSGEWRAPATSQRPIRAGNDVEATRRSCSRTSPPLFFVFFSDSLVWRSSPPWFNRPRAQPSFYLRARSSSSSFFLTVAKVKLLPVLPSLLLPLLLLLLLTLYYILSLSLLSLCGYAVWLSRKRPPVNGFSQPE